MLEVYNVYTDETIAVFQNSSECWNYIMNNYEDPEDWDVREEVSGFDDSYEEEYGEDDIPGSE